jgi:hypothetical protein
MKKSVFATKREAAMEQQAASLLETFARKDV